MNNTKEIDMLSHEKSIENNEKKTQEKKKKKRKNSCSIENCRGRVVFMIGDCKWCNLKFCQEHRIPEAHACSGIEKCKQTSWDQNAENVNGMKCVNPKVAEII